jgi:hypothetical protein
MSRATVIIRNLDDRKQAASWAYQVPFGTRVEFKEVKRTLDQNSKLWAMLTDVARQVQWAGMRLTPGDWKFIFLDALSRERRIVPNIDGTGIVPLYKSTSDLGKSEMSDLIELILAFGAKHDVKFSDEQAAA